MLNISRIGLPLMALAAAGAAYAAPPTVDPTYRHSALSGQGNDFPSATPPSEYLKHLTIPPVSVQVISGADRISAPGKLPGKAPGPLTITLASPDSAPTMLVDFGKELAGRIEIKGTPGGTVIVTTGESREECDHAEQTLDNRGPFPLTLSPEGFAATPYTAFRYAKIAVTGTGGNTFTLNSIACDHKYYPVDYKGSFECSDPLLTKVWYTGAYTAHLCMQEEIWDAPKRDRMAC